MRADTEGKVSLIPEQRRPTDLSVSAYGLSRYKTVELIGSERGSPAVGITEVVPRMFFRPRMYVIHPGLLFFTFYRLIRSIP